LNLRGGLGGPPVDDLTGDSGEFPMATIVTVHGTFAHASGTYVPATQGGGQSAGAATADLSWWQPESTFARDVQTLVQGTGGTSGVAGAHDQTAAAVTAPVTIEPFIWSGENSEVARRVAGAKLLDRMMQLEARNEPYVVVGHSHGGSVIAAALMNSLARRVQLPNMKRWVTIGTPFVSLRPMYWLVDRLNLIQKVVLVASMMLLFMFLADLAGQMLEGGTARAVPFGVVGDMSGKSVHGPWRLALAALMMSLPAIFFSSIFRWVDSRRLFFYRQRTMEAAQQSFGPRWLSLVHKDDEAVQGIRSLPQASFQLFDPAFAVQRLTMLAVFALPVAYLLVLKSPPVMTGIANFLKNSVYQVDQKRAKTYDEERMKIRIRAFGPAAKGPGSNTSPIAGPIASPEMALGRKQRDDLKIRYPDWRALERYLRFEDDFFEKDGKPCPGGTLCGFGQNFSTNSRLLFHIVTDDLTSAIFNDDTKLGDWAVAARAAVPLLIVPTVFVLLALLAMYLINQLARAISALSARLLNRVTLAEVKRVIYGNDTNGEMAIGGGPRPAWMTTAPAFLPAEISGRMTELANQTTAASLAKFRNALSTLALAEGRTKDSSLVSDYLTWKELIHTAYFELPEFRRLFAHAVAEAEGFKPTAAFAGDPSYVKAADWLQALRLDTAAVTAVAAKPSPQQ
jgi:hypothetical protein